MLDDPTAGLLLSIDDFACAVTEHERQAALLALSAARLEATGAFGHDGTASMRAWLRNHLRMTNQRAGGMLSTGRFLTKCSHFADAAVDGSLSASQIQLARRTGQPKYDDILREVERGLVETLKELDVQQTERAVAHWIVRADALLDEKAPPIERPNELTFGTTIDGVTHGTFRLNEAAGTEFDKAVQTAMTHAGTDGTRTIAERHGDAPFDIAAFFNKNHNGNERPRNLPNVTLSADASTDNTEPSIDSHYGSQTEIVRDVAEYLQHRLSENLRVWPECATHSTGLHADRFDDSAVWRCRFGEHSVAAIGHLELAREGARMVDEIFGNRRLAAIYDALDPDRSDLLHYLAIVHEFSARTVLDVGCGTGVFALMLAEHGIDVTGVDPADASLEVARAQPGTDVVRWILGDATTLPPLAVDMAVKTGNVAQVFLSDEAWTANLDGIHGALAPHGRLVFEVRDPARRGWEEWNYDQTFARTFIDGVASSKPGLTSRTCRCRSSPSETATGSTLAS